MQNIMFERRPIPAEILSQLANPNIDVVDRVILAEKCRSEYDWGKTDVRSLCNITEVQYEHANRLIRSDDKRKIQEQGAVILFSSLYFMLYRLNGRLILRVSYYRYGAPRHKSYLLDDFPFVVAVTTEMLRKAQCGQCKIDTFLRVSTLSGERRGDLRHYILAMRAGYPVDTIQHLKIREGSEELVDGMHDWRIANMQCTELSDIISGMYENRAVYSDGDILYVIYEDQLFMFDWSLELSLIFALYRYHYESRDKRMVLRLDNKKTVSLSRFVVASHLYNQHMPIDSAEICKLLLRLRTEHPGKEVDHLNATAQDCRLQNVMLVPAAQNTRKQALQKRLLPLRAQYFADAERHDDEHVHYTAGRFGKDGTRIVEMDKILGFPEYLDALEAFITEAEKSSGIVRRKTAIPNNNSPKRGRKPIYIPNFEKIYARYERNGLTRSQIAQKLEISRPTLNKLIEQYQITPKTKPKKETDNEQTE